MSTFKRYTRRIMQIIYCIDNKRNIFVLGAGYNFAGVINIAKIYKLAEELSTKYNLDLSKMCIEEIVRGNRFKNNIIMFSEEKDQTPIVTASVMSDAYKYLER